MWLIIYKFRKFIVKLGRLVFHFFLNTYAVLIYLKTREQFGIKLYVLHVHHLSFVYRLYSCIKGVSGKLIS